MGGSSPNWTFWVWDFFGFGAGVGTRARQKHSSNFLFVLVVCVWSMWTRTWFISLWSNKCPVLYRADAAFVNQLSVLLLLFMKDYQKDNSPIILGSIACVKRCSSWYFLSPTDWFNVLQIDFSINNLDEHRRRGVEGASLLFLQCNLCSPLELSNQICKLYIGNFLVMENLLKTKPKDPFFKIYIWKKMNKKELSVWPE